MFLMNIEKENLLKIEFNSKKKGNNKETYKVVTRGSIYMCKNRIGNYYLKCYNCFSWLRRKGGEEEKKKKEKRNRSIKPVTLNEVSIIGYIFSVFRTSC